MSMCGPLTAAPAMTIELLFPTLPPALDGIGDHTVRLAAALAPTAPVCIRTGAGPVQLPSDVGGGVTVVDGYDFSSWGGLARLTRDLAQARPDWVLLQYNPFSYGHWGFNPMLPWALRSLRHRAPDTRIALMVHEPFVPPHSWQFALMSTWQRLQLWMLGRQADEILFSIAPWARQFQSWFPDTRVSHLPVGSNMPYVPGPAAEARVALGLPPEALILGVFGSAHPSRLLPHVRAAARAVQAVRPVHVLYVGGAGAAVRAALGDALPFTDTGPLPADEVSRAFGAMDLYLAPFRKGVSTRRGSFMVGLQHGRPCLSTHGRHTDPVLHTHDGSAFCLTPDTDPTAFAEAATRLATDPAARRRLAGGGQRLYESHFDWPVLAERLRVLFAGPNPAPHSHPENAPLSPSPL